MAETYKYGFDHFLFKLYDFNDKEEAQRNYIAYMLNRTQMIFEYKGLPDTIPAKYLELLLQINGYACIAEHQGKLYAYYGGLGGEPDEYYQPTICVVANPAQKFSKEYRIGKDCVIMRNDVLLYGMTPLYRRYATAMVENDISFRMASINTRVTAHITAPDDGTKDAADMYLEDLSNGKLGAIAVNEFLEGIKVLPASNSLRTFTDLIEYQQYLKASWYNEIGLNANYNMKREKLSTTESQMNNDALLPLVDEMLRCRKEAVEEINKMFGTEISVEFGSSWAKLEQEMMLVDESGVQSIGQEDENVLSGSTEPAEGTSVDGDDAEEIGTGDEMQTDVAADGVEEVKGESGDTDVGDEGVSVEVNVEVDVGEEVEEDGTDESDEEREPDASVSGDES